jgi:hypothetical protein
MVSELQQAAVVQSIEWNDGFHAELEGKNGGGDPWHTDGRLAIVLLRSSGQPSDAAESDSFGGR